MYGGPVGTRGSVPERLSSGWREMASVGVNNMAARGPNPATGLADAVCVACVAPVGPPSLLRQLASPR
jgi:hypothetical protein